MASKKTKEKGAPSGASVPAGWGFAHESAEPAEAKELGHEHPRFDWNSLMARAEQLDAPLTKEELDLWKRGLLDGTARQRNREYVLAAQLAVESADRKMLLAMMAAEIPIPAFLLPAVASAFEPRGGRPPEITADADAAIRGWFDLLTASGTQLNKPAKVKKWLAEIKGVSTKSIARSLARTKADKSP